MDKKILEYMGNLNGNEYNKQLYDDIINYESEHFIPAVRYDTALFLKWITSLIKPANVLEIGFGSGVSSVFISHDNKVNNIISLERDKNRYIRGTKLIENFKIKNIQLLNIDAFDFFENNEYTFDMIFLDSVKREYVAYINHIKKILIPGGLLISDNILFNGRVVEDILPDKYIDGVGLLKEFNSIISSGIDFNTFFLPVDDGISLSIKNKAF